MSDCLNLRHKLFLHCNVVEGADSSPKSALTFIFLTPSKPVDRFTLKAPRSCSISGARPRESPGHCEPRVLSPSNGFWLAPSPNQNQRPKHAGVSDTLPRSWRIPPGACLL